MTPKELAEKIVFEFPSIKKTYGYEDILITVLSSALEEAFKEREHYLNMLQWHQAASQEHPNYGPCDALDNGRCTECLRQAKAAAYEQCAKIADEHNGCKLHDCQREPNCSSGIAYQIRSLKDKL